MSDWEFVKRRTAADGAVWRSGDGLLYRRTGAAPFTPKLAVSV